jgi:DNA-binding MarR family transcriptional regulator
MTSVSRVSQILSELETAGAIEKQEGSDKRKKIIHLTELGRNLIIKRDKFIAYAEEIGLNINDPQMQ